MAGDPLPGGADLVSAQYLHVPEAGVRPASTPRSPRRSGPAAPCSWSATTPPTRDTGLRNPRLSHLLFAPERVTALLDDGWQIDVADAPTREVEDEPRSRAPVVVTDTVVLAHASTPT